MIRGVVENAAARYQAQGRVAGGAVNGFRREPGFEVLPYAGDAEPSGDPVGERHVHSVPGAEGAQPEEDSRTPITVKVTFDDRRPDLAGRRRTGVQDCQRADRSSPFDNDINRIDRAQDV